MNYLLYAVAALAVLIGLVVLIAALRPSNFSVVRSQLIAASPQKLFPYINNLKMFQEWSPYKDKDPNAKNEFSGPESGPGARFRWDGNSNVGEGSMTISSNETDSKVGVNLEFIRPFRGQTSVEFKLEPQSAGTLVSWRINGKHALIPKIMGLFIDMDQMIGGDFEVGLKRLKSLAEST